MSQLKNYRANFYFAMNKACDYYGKDKSKLTFRQVHYQCYPLVKAIKVEAKKLGIKYIWHFYEPFVEITWLSSSRKQADALFAKIEKILKSHKIDDLEKKYPDGSWDGDWFCTGPEKDFGNKRHSLCSDFVELSEEHFEAISKGRQIEKQVSRTIHTLCNPLGINYKDEGKLCIARGIKCLLLWYLKGDKYIKVIGRIFGVRAWI